jgi:hypothetical protein
VLGGFLHEVDEICALLGYYAPYSDNSLPTFRDNLSVPFSMAKNLRIELLTQKSANLNSLLAYAFNLKTNSEYLQIN